MDKSFVDVSSKEEEIRILLRNGPEAMSSVQEKKGDAVSFKKYGLISFIFAIVYTFCLYKNHSGITYPIFMAATLTCLGYLRHKEGKTLISDVNGNKVLGIFYIASLMLLAIHRCLTTSWAIIALETLSTILLMFSYVIFLYIDTSKFDVVAWFESLFFTVLKPIEHFTSPVIDFIAFRVDNTGKMDEEKKKNLYAVLIGIVIAIPLLMIVISLLSSADMVFSRLTNNLWHSIELPTNFGDIIGVILTAVGIFWIAYTVICSLGKKELSIKTGVRGSNNPIIAITFTSILGIVYVAFCLIQVLCLFTGTVELPASYTYAGYAHEGFYQLVFVCLINLIMVSLCQRIFKKSNVLRLILTTIVVCTYIMIASSAYRMLLYIGVYHLTFLRLFVLWFLVVLAMWLLFLIISMYKESFPVFKASMVAITIAFVGFVYANPDYQIAKYDLLVTADKIDEYSSVQDYILDNLSTDAAPALVEKPMLMKQFELEVISRYNQEHFNGIRKYNISYERAQVLFENMK